MKYSLYILGSLLLASLVLVRACYLRPNFWSAAILLSQSNGSLLILTNLALIWTGGTVYLLQRIFYGRLRPIEVEQLYEKGWVAVTETALALTIFREDVGTRFFVMFLSLMVGKVWAWIGEGRIEFMEQQPSASRMPTIRLAASLSISLLFDIVMLGYCLETLAREPRPGMWVMYAFEYVILLVQSASLFLRFALNVTESIIVQRQTQIRIQTRRDEVSRQREEVLSQAQPSPSSSMTAPESNFDDMDVDVAGWEDKGRWMFYLDLMTDFIKSLVYCGFFLVLLFFHGLPLHIMRDLYITVRSFVKRITDFIQYRNATKDMNTRYPDATAAELQSDNTCIICREEMTAWGEAMARGQTSGNPRVDERQRPKKLPCGHILHFGCLRSWLERQRVCPTCRRSVLSQDNGSQTNRNATGAGARQQNNAQPQAVIGNRPNAQNGQPVDGGGQPVNQFRVLNFGPLRVAFGRTPGPGGVQGLLQRMANPQQMNQQQQHQQSPFQLGPADAILAQNPFLIHQQIIQLQAQILELMQRLNGEHLQLDILERLVTELIRLQSEQHTTSSSLSVMPQALAGVATPAFHISRDSRFIANQDVQVHDLQLPPGMILPAGYTLQRLHAVEPSQPHSHPTVEPSASSSFPLEPSRAADHPRSPPHSGSTEERSCAAPAASLHGSADREATIEAPHQRRPRTAMVEDA